MEENKETKEIKTIFERVNNVKLRLCQANLKKTGKNTYQGYSYYELADFLPTLIKLMQEEGVCSYFQFSTEKAVLILSDIVTGNTIEVISQMAVSTLKGSQDIQNLGSAQTYFRRYLYMNAFDIVESDNIDSADSTKSVKSSPASSSSSYKAPASTQPNTPTIAPLKETDRTVDDSIEAASKLTKQAKVKELMNKLVNNVESERKALIKEYSTMFGAAANWTEQDLEHIIADLEVRIGGKK